MNQRMMKIYQAARDMIFSGKDLTRSGLPEVVALRDVSGVKDITPKERDEATKTVREEQQNSEVNPAVSGKTSYQVVIPNIRPITQRRLMGRFQNVFDEDEDIVPVSLRDGHIQIDFPGSADPEGVKTTVLEVLSGWGFAKPEQFVR